MNLKLRNENVEKTDKLRFKEEAQKTLGCVQHEQQECEELLYRFWQNERRVPTGE